MGLRLEQKGSEKMRVVQEENTYNDIFIKIPETSYFERLFSRIESLESIFYVIEKLYFENLELKEQLEEQEEKEE